MSSGLPNTLFMTQAAAPTAGLTSSTPVATVSLTEGCTRTLRSCVSRARSTLPFISTLAAGPWIWRSRVSMTPWVTAKLPLRLSKAKPSLKMSRKSRLIRRGSDCRLTMPRSRPTPGSSLLNWPLAASSFSWPLRLP